MKFTIYSGRREFDVTDDKDKDLIAELRKLGFTFDVVEWRNPSYTVDATSPDNKVSKTFCTATISFSPTIEINSIEALMELVGKFGDIAIIRDIGDRLIIYYRYDNDG